MKLCIKTILIFIGFPLQEEMARMEFSQEYPHTYL